MKLSIRIFIILIFTIGIFSSPSVAAEDEDMTIRFLCWKDYATPYLGGFKALVKEKYNINLKTEVNNVSKPTEFWSNARKKTVDLISPAHNIPMSRRKNFAESGVALEINLANVPNYKNLLRFLQKNRFVTMDGKVFAVPYTIGHYGLAYNSEKVSKPESWAVLWDPKNKNQYTVSRDYPDCNVYTTALAAGATYNDIYNYDKLIARIPREALQNRLNALAANAASLWEGTANPAEFPNLTYAATWGYAVAIANKNGGKWKMAKPREGSTSWIDHWLITFAVQDDPKKKKICEEWINYCISTKLQTGVIRNWGVSPVITNLTTEHITNNEMQTFNVGDNDFWKSLSLWQTQNSRTIQVFKNYWSTAIKARKQ